MLTQLLQKYNFFWDGQDVTYLENLSNHDRVESKKKTLHLISHALQLEGESVRSGSEAKDSDDGSEEKLDSKFVLASLDQTWANMGTNMERSWIHNCGNDATCRICDSFNKLAGRDTKLRTCIRKRAKGKRMAIQHVVTRLHGLLNATKDGKTVQRLPRTVGDKFAETQLTSEFIMSCGSSKGDYHRNIDKEREYEYFEKRLIPTFESKFPGKSLILLMDRAPYHVARTGYPSSNCNKKQIIEYYKKHGIKQVKVKRLMERNKPLSKPKVFEKPIEECLQNAPNGASKDELLLYLWDWLKINKPDALQPDIERLMNSHGHYIIWNTPNNPDYVPSEMFNGYLKWWVKKTVSHDRGVEKLYNDILDGMYGKEGEREGATVERCELWWNHCMELMQHDMGYFGMETTDIRKLWKPNCGYSVLDSDIITPISAAKRKKCAAKFQTIIA